MEEDKIDESAVKNLAYILEAHYIDSKPIKDLLVAYKELEETGIELATEIDCLKTDYEEITKELNEKDIAWRTALNELKQEKEKNKKLDRENQALYESINCDDKNMLERLYKEEKEKNKELLEGLKYRVKYCGLLERELYGNENIELTKIEQELLQEGDDK